MLHRSRILLWLFLMLAGQPLCWAQDGQGQSGTGVFFSQGQAIYDAQDLAKSQQAAIQDFMGQAVTQALGSFLSPEQMGQKYATLQNHVLKDPQRYVQAYQLFSEQPVNGLYRVTGKATIAMKTLRTDLQKLGFQLAETPAEEPAAAPEQATSVQETTPPAATGSAETQEQQQEQEPAGGRKILWAVAEREAGGWNLAYSNEDQEAAFAMSVLQESSDYDWSLSFPKEGALAPGAGGKVSQHAAVALAKQMGLPAAITGFVALGEDPHQGLVLKTALQVLDVASDQSLGEVHKELVLQGTSFQEGVMNLAAAVIPELDSLLGRKPQPAGVSRTAPGNGGEWTLIISGDHRQAYWGQLEQLLREHYHSLRVRSIELGPQQAKIHLAGLDPDFYNVLQQLKLSNGAQMQVDRYSPELHAVAVTVGQN